MSRGQSVLIVDDDEILRHGMKAILEAEGFEVGEAGDGAEAKQALSERRFTLIVSDVEMPKLDGVQLLKLVKDGGLAQVLLISEFSHALQHRHAVALGADGFINKPFRKEDFVQAVRAALEAGADEAAASLEADYVPVPVSDFVTGSVLRVDLYVKLSNQKYLKIGNKGGAFAPERALSYQAKGVRWFHMIKADFAYYVGFNMNLAQAVHTTDRIECARKIRLTMHVTENLISALTQAGLNREQLEDASNVVMNAVDLIASNPPTLKLLESMEVCGSLSSHSIAVAIWSCLIARQVKWEGQSTYFRLAICALFHDVGEKEMSDDVNKKARWEMTKQERKIHEGHTIRGRDILLSVPGMPEDVATVALQHHELTNGGGYPYGLKLHQIHPFARIISVADNLCELLKHQPAQGQPTDYASFLQVMRRNERDFDPTFLRALAELVPGTRASFERVS